MQITPYPEIEKLLSSLLYQMQQILDKNLTGLYLYGSLVTGDFDPEISDIDLLAVTSSDVDDKEFEQLRNMHSDLIAQNPNWDGRIEIHSKHKEVRSPSSVPVSRLISKMPALIG
jgi:predicted nucleotidyltransferase